MEVGFRVAGEDAAAAIRSLEAWLAGNERLRGRVRPVFTPLTAGVAHPVAHVLTVQVGRGGAAAALASGLVDWARRQQEQLSITATRPDGTELTLTAGQVRGLHGTEVSALVDRVAATLEDDTPGGPRR